MFLQINFHYFPQFFSRITKLFTFLPQVQKRISYLIFSLHFGFSFNVFLSSVNEGAFSSVYSGYICACPLEPDTWATLLWVALITQTPCDAVCIPRSQTMLVAMEIHTLQLFFLSASPRSHHSRASVTSSQHKQTSLRLLQDSQNVINWQVKIQVWVSRC